MPNLENDPIFKIIQFKKKLFIFTICKINILQFERLIIIPGQIISKKWKNLIETKTIESFVILNSQFWNSEISVVLHFVVPNFDPDP